MTAPLITQAQLEAIHDADDVAHFSGGNAGVLAEAIEEASDWVQEYAAAAGVTLTDGSLTAAMRRRVASRVMHTLGSRRKEDRDGEGRAPYHLELAEAKAELEAWAARTRSLSTDAPSDDPVVLSDEARGWTGSGASSSTDWPGETL